MTLQNYFWTKEFLSTSEIWMYYLEMNDLDQRQHKNHQTPEVHFVSVPSPVNKIKCGTLSTRFFFYRHFIYSGNHFSKVADRS